MAVAKIAGNFDHATNPHPHPTDFAHEILIRRMQILAGSVTTLLITELKINTEKIHKSETFNELRHPKYLMPLASKCLTIASIHYHPRTDGQASWPGLLG